MDSPEAGLDAIGQAMLCTDLIGWRHHARKIIFLITEGELHFALDGKLGGIFNVFDDTQCRTDPSTKIYTDELKFDYPSIGQVGVTRKQFKKAYRSCNRFFEPEPGSGKGRL